MNLFWIWFTVSYQVDQSIEKSIDMTFFEDNNFRAWKSSRDIRCREWYNRWRIVNSSYGSIHMELHVLGVHAEDAYKKLPYIADSEFYIDYGHYSLESFWLYGTNACCVVDGRWSTSWQIWQVSNAWTSVFKSKSLQAKLSGPDILLSDSSSYSSNLCTLRWLSLLGVLKL